MRLDAWRTLLVLLKQQTNQATQLETLKTPRFSDNRSCGTTVTLLLSLAERSGALRSIVGVLLFRTHWNAWDLNKSILMLLHQSRACRLSFFRRTSRWCYLFISYNLYPLMTPSKQLAAVNRNNATQIMTRKTGKIEKNHKDENSRFSNAAKKKKKSCLGL